MRLLVRLYPEPWRARYGEEFELLLRQWTPGPRAVLDVLRGALDAHRRASTPRRALAWLLLGLGCAVIGWLNFHAADDVQPVAAALLVLGFAFGFWRPGRAWLFALVLFAAVPVSGAGADAVSYHPGVTRPAPLYETIVALVPALLGAYGGAAVRWAARAHR